MFQATNADLVERETDVRHTLVTILLLRLDSHKAGIQYQSYCSNRLLRGSDFYSSADVEVPSSAGAPFKDEEVVMGKLLHRLRLVQDMNAHPIWGVEPDPRDCSRVATHNIGENYFENCFENHITMCISGGGFYSVIASYFNSDCNPNTVRINMGREMFLVATRNIRKGELTFLHCDKFSQGEEITDNYCAVFSELGVSARKQFLRVGETFPFHSSNLPPGELPLLV